MPEAPWHYPYRVNEAASGATFAEPPPTLPEPGYNTVQLSDDADEFIESKEFGLKLKKFHDGWSDRHRMEGRNADDIYDFWQQHLRNQK